MEIEPSLFHHSSPLSLRDEQGPQIFRPTTPPPSETFLRTAASFESESKRRLAQPVDSNNGYDVFCSVRDDSGEELEDELSRTHDADQLDADRRISGGSSISSFPASESHRAQAIQDQYGSPRPRIRRDSNGARSFARNRDAVLGTTSPRSPRVYHSVFRHPSSVRSLQMKDEIMSDTHSVIRHHRRNGSQMSMYSQRSTFSNQTSPVKRASRSSPHKPSGDVKTEYPLVLLHCTLLPPSLLLQRSTSCEDSLICEFLPEKYRKRWTALRDKLIGDVEVRTRGILISHPKEDYELLEERLLESLELENPRIRENHYLHSDASGVDSGFESGSLSEGDADLDCSIDVSCPDCGRRLDPKEADRKWEIKVFAANGLMRAGAWGAAWQEMEKVDVEVRVWLPEEVRQDLEAKVALLEASHNDMDQVEPDDHVRNPEAPTPREREIYGDSGRFSSHAETHPVDEARRTLPDLGRAASHPELREHSPQSWLAGYARDLCKDSRNILIALLSLLVLLFALTGSQMSSAGSGTKPTGVTTPSTEVLTTTVTTPSTEFLTATVTTTMVEISVETVSGDIDAQTSRNSSLSPLDIASTATSIHDHLPSSLPAGTLSEPPAQMSEGGHVALQSIAISPHPAEA